jgi:pimeloyl-ACP methyl ester carboxylesterase
MFYLLVLFIVIIYMLNILVPATLGHYVYNSTMWLESKLYGFSKKTVAVNSIDICFLTNKNLGKETIIMLHGFSSDKNVWLRFAKHFTQDYQVIIPDLSGHGETLSPAHCQYDAISQVTIVNHLLERLDINKVHIIGSSMGGLIAAHFAHIHPNKIASTALVDPAGVRSPKLSEKDIMVNEGNNPFLIHSRAEFDRFYAMTMATPPWLPDCVLATLSEKYQKNINLLTQIHHDFHHKNMLDDVLQTINCPMLILWGHKDKIIDISSLDVWQNGLPQAKIKTWQDIGHLPILEIPKESAKVYQQFIHSAKKQ